MHRCYPCFILDRWTSPKADGHHYSQIYSFRVSHGCIHSVLSLCPQPSAWTQIKKRNTDITDFTRIGLSRIFFFDNIWVSDSWILLWIYLDLRVLTHSLSWRLVLRFIDKNLVKPLYPFASLTAWFLSHRSPLREQALDSLPAWQESVETTSPPRKSIQAINQDKPAAQESCSLFVIISYGGNINYDSAHRHQPPPNRKPLLTFPKGRNRLLRILVLAPT